MKQIVIVGGGFAGVKVARKLRKQKNIAVTVVNDTPDFRYYPTLYRVATGFKLGTARLPLEWMLLDGNNTDLVIGKAQHIDTKQKFIELEDSTRLDYDYAVLALGSVTSYFNINGIHEHAFGIKSVEEVTALRKHIHENITTRKNEENNYVIVGAGPSGVELAGALGAHLRRLAKKHRAKNHGIKIWLVEAAPRVLPMMNPRVSKAAERRLRKLGVKLALDTRVKAETIGTLKTSVGTIKTHTVIWTAGTANNPFFANNADSFTLNERQRVVVDSQLQARPSVYVIGDNAATPYSGTALTAVRHGNFTAKDIIKRTKHKRRPTKYESRPILVVPIGKGWAILQYRGLVLKGRLISLVRKMADLIGYSDVLGIFRALTIWSNSEKVESSCQTCKR